ncbi:hypothetical protein H1C71_022472, partial [Ictidomys tridecemlineatus]
RLGGGRSGLGGRLSWNPGFSSTEGAPGPAFQVGASLPRRPCPRAPRLGPQLPRCRGMDRAALRAATMGEKKEGGGGGAGAAASRALQQCGQLQKLIDISLGSLRGLRTKCAVSNDLTQQEIRTLEVRVRYSKGSRTPTGREERPQLTPSRVASWNLVPSLEASSVASLADAAA